MEADDVFFNDGELQDAEAVETLLKLGELMCHTARVLKRYA